VIDRHDKVTLPLPYFLGLPRDTFGGLEPPFGKWIRVCPDASYQALLLVGPSWRYSVQSRSARAAS
jgi:hypothetical protein